MLKIFVTRLLPVPNRLLEGSPAVLEHPEESGHSMRAINNVPFVLPPDASSCKLAQYAGERDVWWSQGRQT
jgi:hypothetical protein